MKFLKPVIATLLTASLVLSLAACDGSGTSSEEFYNSSRAGVESVFSDLEIDGDEFSVELENKTITWFGYYGPDDSPDVAPAIEIFKERFGGTVEYENVAWADWSDKLANLVLSGDPPDITPKEDTIFPSGFAAGHYEALDDYIDIESPLWAGVADVVEQYAWNGQHYYFPWTVTNGAVLQYDRDLVSELGLDDPYDLYLEGKWDWNAFSDMVYEFKDLRSDMGENVWGYACRSNTPSDFVATTGKSLISVSEDGTLAHNIYDKDVERTMDFLTKLKNDGVLSNYQSDAPLADGKILFYSAGIDTLSGYMRALPDRDLFFVPYPRDPNSTTYYTPGSSFSYLVIKGSKNIEGAVAFLNSCRVMMTDDEFLALYKDFYVNGTEKKRGTGFTDEQFDLMMELRGEKANLIVDVSLGFSQEIRNNISEMYDTGFNPEVTDSWQTMRGKYEAAIQAEIDTYNAYLK
ncbi:MAG TPA: ABC transporter substrate-binding protein [Oscillospiraceae bacterium]|nr:ABC transporter substrate-binding protein [Oscillospiraceae bacterium]